MAEDIDALVRKDRNRYITESWKGLAASVKVRDHQFMNWLFTLHAGGVAGGLSYAASKGAGPCLLWSIGIFACSLILILIFGAKMFYNESALFSQFQELVKRYYTDRATWEELEEWESKRPSIHKGPERMAWIAGLSVLPAVLLLIIAIA